MFRCIIVTLFERNGQWRIVCGADNEIKNECEKSRWKIVKKKKELIIKKKKKELKIKKKKNRMGRCIDHGKPSPRETFRNIPNYADRQIDLTLKWWWTVIFRRISLHVASLSLSSLLAVFSRAWVTNPCPLRDIPSITNRYFSILPFRFVVSYRRIDSCISA